MALTADQIGPTVSPYLDSFFGWAWTATQFLLIILAIGYVFLLYTYNVKITIREYTKGARTIVYTTNAREYTERKSGAPKLQFFGKFGFSGRKINQPPAECIIPYKSMFKKKMYDFIKKDDLFFPVKNLVLGQRYEVPKEDIQKLPHSVLDNYKVGVKDDHGVLYSTQGSGLEVSRDYDAEQAIQNNLIGKAEAYRNEKPTVLYAMYGLAIILAIGSFITMIYSWNQFGNVAGAIDGLKAPIETGITEAVNQRLGPN